MFFVVFSILLFFLISFYNFYWKRRNLPPGPIPLPLIGNLLAIKNSGTGERQYKKWAKKFGPIYTYWMGELPVICVADYEKMVELFKKNGDTFVDRYQLPIERKLMDDGKFPAHGILIANGQCWKEQRKFALKILKQFGMGKNLMQWRILNELSSMFAKINSHLDDGIGEWKIVNLIELMEISTGSIINQILFGYSFEGDREAEFWEIKRIMDEHLSEFGGHSLFWMYMFWPNLLQNVPWFRQKRKLMEERIRCFHEYFGKRIVERQKQIDLTNLDTESSDFVEAFLKEKERREKGMSKTKMHNFNIFQLGMMCFDLYITGQETTSTAMNWGMAFLLNNEKCMQKMRTEIGSVTGQNELMVTVEKRPKLPYTNAVINEILRLGNIAPHNFLRKVGQQDIEIGDGILLKAGTCISPQISALLCDEKIFEEPELFRPERFLDENGNLKKIEEFLPFSIGRRQCLGESMAKMELFLFFANLLHRYEILPIDNPPSLQRIPGAVVHCSPFKCRMRKLYTKNNINLI